MTDQNTVMKHLLATLAGLSLLLPTVAMAAAPQKKVAVFVVKGKRAAPAEAAAMQTLLRKQLGSLTGVRQLTGSPEPAATLDSLVGSKLEDGFRLLSDKKGAEAEVVFNAQLEVVKKYTGHVSKRTLARIFKGLGVARGLQSKLTAAREMMKASLNVYTEQTAPEYAYTIEVRDTFSEVEGKVADEKKGSISIETEPPGAEVRIGDDVKGFTPITVEGLSLGHHFIQVQLDGFHRASALVKIDSEEEGAEAFGLKPRTDKAGYDALFKKAAKKPGSKKVMVKVLPKLKTMLGADGVLIMGLTSKGGYVFNGFYVDANDALVPRRETVTGDVTAILSQLGRMISSTVGAPMEKETDPAPLDAPPQASVVTESGETLFVDPNDLLRDPGADDGDSVVDKWWFWTIVGVAVGGVTAMVVVLATADGGKTGPRGTAVLDLKAVVP